jgi:hypothetical protein
LVDFLLKEKGKGKGKGKKKEKVKVMQQTLEKIYLYWTVMPTLTREEYFW